MLSRWSNEEAGWGKANPACATTPGLVRIHASNGLSDEPTHEDRILWIL